jgi:hypothetical protein
MADIPEKAAEPTTQQPTPTAATPPLGNNAPYVADDPTVTYEPPDVVDVPVPVPADPADTQPAPPSNSQQEEPVTALTATAPVAQQPQGETNLDLTVVDLTEVETLLALVDDGVDQVAQTGQRLDTAISRATERAVLAGAPAATMAALDAASGVSRQLGDHLSGVSQASTEAGDQVTAARHSLTPAQDAQDRLHSAGARGEFVSTATSD